MDVGRKHETAGTLLLAVISLTRMPAFVHFPEPQFPQGDLNRVRLHLIHGRLHFRRITQSLGNSNLL